MARTKVNLKTTASLLKFASEVDPTGVQPSTTAIADLDAAEDSCTLPPGRYRVDADLTLTAGWRAEPGAVLVPDNLVTVTLPSAFEGSPGCLDTSAGGDFAFSEAPQAVDVRWFGATITTDSFTSAATLAGSAGAPLDVGNGTIELEHTSTIDLSGIPALLGNAVIDCSGSTAHPKFLVQGSRSLLASEQALSQGANTLTLPADSVVRGDTVVLTSDEAWPSVTGFTGTYGYYKGSRHTVQSVSGTNVTVFPYFPVDYLGAYVWRVDEARISIGKGISILGNPGAIEAGLRLEYADADIAAYFQGFGTAALIYACSRGSFTGTVRDVHYTGTTTSYGVAVGDMSQVRISADIEAGRHAVQGGGGALFNLSESGGADLPAAYPASYTLNGGVYKTGSIDEYAAVDAHSNMDTVVISGATIYGGVTFGGRHMSIGGGTKIYFKGSHGIEIRDDNRNVAFGVLEIDGVSLESMGGSGTGATGHGIDKGTAPKIAALRIRGLTISGHFDTGRPLNITGECGEIDIDSLTIRRLSGASSSAIQCHSRTRLRGLDVEGDTVIATVLATGVVLELEDSAFLNGISYGFLAAVSGGNEWTKVIVRGVRAAGNPSSGLRIEKSLHFVGRNIVSNDNGSDTGAASANRSGLTLSAIEKVDLAGCDLSSSANQIQGLYHSVYDAGDPTATTVLLSDIDLRGNTGSTQIVVGGTVLRRRGVLGTISAAPIADVIESADGDLFQIDASGALVAFP